MSKEVYGFSDVVNYLEDNGWYFSHSTNGFDNHYISDDTDIPFDIIFDVATGECDFYHSVKGNLFNKHYKYIYSPTVNDMKMFVRCIKIKKIKEKINDTQ